MAEAWHSAIDGRTTAARRALIAVLTLAVALLATGPAWSQDAARGRKIFQLCAACHGPSGAGNKLYRAPAIAGLPRSYVEAQLTKFKDGVRGFRAEDTEGLQMRPMARSLTTKEDVAAVAAYVASLKPASPPAPTVGDAARGQAAYTVCLACHGPQAAGNEALNAPPLARQADWYLVAQLEKFRKGLRGTHEKDVTGAQMRAMAMTLTSEQAIADVVAYIRSLGR